MTEAYIDKNYVYAVARIRGYELKLLTKQSFSELIAIKTSDAFIKALKEKGWGEDKDITAEDVLKSERKKLWELIDEIVPDKSIFEVFKIANDYHNLKAAIKESTMEFAYDGIYIDEANNSVDIIRDSIKEKKYEDLPVDLRDIAEKAHSVFLQTGDGQLSDIMVDKASLEAIVAASKKSNDEILKMYAELVCASSNIKICMRAAMTNKDKEFLDRAVAECDTLDREQIISAALGGVDNICTYLQNTDYVEAIPEIKKSLATFEKWCDNLVINRMKSQLSENFGLGPIIAYIIARENEIKTVRIIYTGIENGFSEEMIRERVRETYV